MEEVGEKSLVGDGTDLLVQVCGRHLKITFLEVQAFAGHINLLDAKIKYTKPDSMAFLGSAGWRCGNKNLQQAHSY